MGRRLQRQELEFGSDSFLDVIANTVGIVIILIVITGLRVSHAPVVITPASSEPLLVADNLRPDTTPDIVEQHAEENFPDPEVLTRELARLRKEEEFLRKRISTTEELQGSLESEIGLGREKLSHLASELDGLIASEEDQKREYELAMRSVEERKQELSELISQITVLESKPLPVKRIKHSVTPISKQVDTEEVHFRIAENKVSFVPMQELIERLKLEAERNKSMLARVQRNEGVVGPVDGYSMRYLLERQGLSPLDQARFGEGVFKIQVSTFQIVPEDNLVEETINEALQPGSQFFKVLKRSSKNATFTFWVYPDCFASFRRIQTILRDGGLTIAARPIPNGMPITGSPGGSKSAGQ